MICDSFLAQFFFLLDTYIAVLFLGIRGKADRNCPTQQLNGVTFGGEQSRRCGDSSCLPGWHFAAVNANFLALWAWICLTVLPGSGDAV